MPNETQIFLGAAHDGNSDYELPKSSEIIVEAVAATFTDNGAGSDWCPAVVYISDSGHVIARALLPDVRVTAGDDAEVSWFPGVKPGGSAAGLPSAAVSLDIGTGDFAAGTHDLPVANLSTSSPSIFSTPGGGSSLINIAQDGFYLVAGSLSFTTQQLIEAFLDLFVVQDNALGWSSALDVIPNDATSNGFVSYMHGVTFASMAAGDFISGELQTDADISNVSAAGLAIVQLNRTRLI